MADGSPDWDKYVDALELVNDVAVLGVTDYFSVDGYRALREFREEGKLKNFSMILPNIEFRLDKVIATSKGPRRLNYHVLFSDSIAPNEIEEHFLQELKFCYQGDPQREDLKLTVRRENLVMLGSRLKEEHEPFRDRSDYEIGCINATVDPSQIKDVLRMKGQIFRGKYLIVLAEEYVSLLDWNGQDHQTRKVLLQGADAIFSANAKTIAWARGEGGMAAEDVIKEFRSLKPCLHGSDAHKLEDLCKPAGERYCWIKSDTTFEGLKQTVYEPSDRVFIGDAPPNLKHDYQVIDSITISDAPAWFAPMEIPLNRDLVAVIGPRGSGKSALAEMIAFAGGAEAFGGGSDISDSFLSKASRRSVTNPEPVTNAKISLRWADGSPDETSRLNAEIKHGRVEEKVKYLPQKFVEHLCAPENNRRLEEEIERVIFQRIDKTEKLDASDFGELREKATQGVVLKRSRLVQAIQALNQTIESLRARIATKSAKEQELKSKKEDLTSLEKAPPQVPEQSKDDLALLESVQQKKQEIETAIVRLSEQMSILDDISNQYAVFQQDVDAFNQRIAEKLSQVGLQGQIPDFAITVPKVDDVIIGRRTLLMAEIEALRTGPDDRVTLASLSKQIEEIRVRSTLSDTKRKEYEKYQRDKQQVEAMISSLDRELREIVEVITPKLKDEIELRKQRYADAFELLKEERNILMHLYEPLHKALEASNETAKKLTFVCRTTFNCNRHASRAMELLDRRRSLFRDQDELEIELRAFFDRIQTADFDPTAVKDAVAVLLGSFQNRNGTKLGIGEQLRKDRTLQDFAQWFFSIDDFAVAYSIEFDGKDLQLLSPGEKGIVLLLLYLEAETEDNRPLIIDQPDDNLDNVSVYPGLVQYFRARKKSRQVIIITHNPNLVVNTDAEQIFVAKFDGAKKPKLSYRSGSLENTNSSGTLGIREEVCRILEGGTKAFQLREQRYDIT